MCWNSYLMATQDRLFVPCAHSRSFPFACAESMRFCRMTTPSGVPPSLPCSSQCAINSRSHCQSLPFHGSYEYKYLNAPIHLTVHSVFGRGSMGGKRGRLGCRLWHIVLATFVSLSLTVRLRFSYENKPWWALTLVLRTGASDECRNSCFNRPTFLDVFIKVADADHLFFRPHIVYM